MSWSEFICVSFLRSFPFECDFYSLHRRFEVIKLLYEEIFQVRKETTENQMEDIS